MPRNLRLNRVVTAGLAAVLLIALAACSGNYPNSTFHPTTDVNRDLTGLWNTMMFWGTLVFVIVEAILIIAIVRFRRRPGGPEARHVHGNTIMEITWTLAPALILVFIAVPTVRTIFRTQSKAVPTALQVEVIGHQWWWEFRYPEYGITTANELYLPYGRTVNFALRTNDVLHSFWIPALAGKRDLITNRTNYLWFTPDSTGEAVFNGSCNEYCGASHANMRFRTFTVAPADFDKWVAGQKATAIFPVAAPTAPAPGAPATPGASVGALAKPAAATSSVAIVPVGNAAPAQESKRDAPPSPGAVPAPTATPAPAEPWAFPRERIPSYAIPKTPIPSGVSISDAVIAAGDAQRGFKTYSQSACIGCHRIRGNPMSQGIIGPDLTHIGSRFTIAGGYYPNDPKHLAHWIKNARVMKPGVLMQTMGKGETDPVMKMKMSVGGLTDEQIADVVAYMLSLK